MKFTARGATLNSEACVITNLVFHYKIRLKQANSNSLTVYRVKQLQNLKFMSVESSVVHLLDFVARKTTSVL